jgi:hypothetical protein
MKRAPELTGPAIRDAIAATKNYAGVTGNITIGADRNPIKPAVVLKVAQGGKYEFAAKIYPPGVAENSGDQAAPTGPKKTEGNTAPNPAPGTTPTPTRDPAVGATSSAAAAATTGQPQGVPAGEHSK